MLSVLFVSTHKVQKSKGFELESLFEKKLRRRAQLYGKILRPEKKTCEEIAIETLGKIVAIFQSLQG